MSGEQGLLKKIGRLIERIGSHHTGAYAAQAAYFFVLSMIPIIWLLLTLVQFTPITRDVVLQAVLQVFPSTAENLIRSLVTQIYAQSGTVIPITIIVALWSAGKGVLSLTTGLNLVYDTLETRNYLYLRFRASFYTVLFILAIVFSLIVSVFGNSIGLMVYRHAAFLSHVVDFVIQTRTFLTLIVMTLFWDVVYKYLPNRKEATKTTFRRQLPGAFFSACGWVLISYVFSIYLDIFTGFTTMYGSLTTIILILLWLYMCMYTILLGGEMNTAIERYERRLKESSGTAH